MNDIDALRRQADATHRTSEAATRAYDRGTWIRLSAHFFVVPFAVVALRYHLEAWGYVLMGIAYVMLGSGLHFLDRRDHAARDRAVRDAALARCRYDDAMRRAGQAQPPG